MIAACVGGLLVGGSSDFGDALVLRDHPGPALAVLGWLALVNAGLFVFNLIPAYPLDGGRIARAIAWKFTGDRNRGTRFSARLGQAFSYILMGLGIFLLVRGDAGSGIWWILLGWFLGQSATGAVVSSRFSERLEGVTVADVMDTQPVWVPGDTTVLQAQDEFFLRYAGRGSPSPIRFGAVPRAAARGPRRRRRAGGPARRCTSPTCSTRTATRPSASTTTPRSSSSRVGGPALPGRADGHRQRRPPARRRHARAGPPRARLGNTRPRGFRIALMRSATVSGSSGSWR